MKKIILASMATLVFFATSCAKNAPKQAEPAEQAAAVEASADNYKVVPVSTSSPGTKVMDEIKKLYAGKVVLVDFWATWCGPCRALSPTVEEIAEEYAGKVDVVKCNVDDADQIAMQYRIMSIPTLLYFKGGQLVDRTVGLVDKDDIVARLSKLI